MQPYLYREIERDLRVLTHLMRAGFVLIPPKPSRLDFIAPSTDPLEYICRRHGTTAAAFHAETERQYQEFMKGAMRQHPPTPE